MLNQLNCQMPAIHFILLSYLTLIIFFEIKKDEKRKVEKTAVSPEERDEDGDFNTAIDASLKSYTEDGDLHLAIMASLQSGKDQNFTVLSQHSDDHMFDFMPQQTSSLKKVRGNQEEGQSSGYEGDPEFNCEICVESKSINALFPIIACTHAYCNDCVVMYVESKLQENISKIKCPVSECQGWLDPEYCRPILPQQVFDRWGKALCEAQILGSQKFYCPFKDCSVMLIDDGEEVVEESECPNCRRLFCAKCKVAWHAGIKCKEFQTLRKNEREREDIMLMDLAKKKKWRRCPSCRMHVERIEGCAYMKCRCGKSFCYRCGSIKICTSTHYCYNCKG